MPSSQIFNHINGYYQAADNQNAPLNNPLGQGNDARERDLANRGEGAMAALTDAQQLVLERIHRLYDAQLAQRGLNAVMNELRTYLESQYAANPATHNGRNLPLDGSGFLNQGAAKKAYYQHAEHSAWRYLFCRSPNFGGQFDSNPWIDPNAPYQQRNFQGESIYSDISQRNLRLIASLWLAANDEQRTTDTNAAKALLATNLAVCGRGHNWDHQRPAKNPDGTNKYDAFGAQAMEYYDDMQADKPTCGSGIEQRLIRSLMYHQVNEDPSSRLLNEQLVKQRFVEQWVQHSQDNPHSIHSRLDSKPFQELFILKKWYEEYNSYYAPMQDSLDAGEQEECAIIKANLDELFDLQAHHHAIHNGMNAWWTPGRMQERLNTPLRAGGADNFASYSDYTDALKQNPMRYCYEEILSQFNATLAAKEDGYIDDILVEFGRQSESNLETFLNALRLDENPLPNELKLKIIEEQQTRQQQAEARSRRERREQQERERREQQERERREQERQQRAREARLFELDARIVDARQARSRSQRVITQANSALKKAALGAIGVGLLFAAGSAPLLVPGLLAVATWKACLFIGSALSMTQAISAAIVYYNPWKKPEIDEQIRRHDERIRIAERERDELSNNATLNNRRTFHEDHSPTFTPLRNQSRQEPQAPSAPARPSVRRRLVFQI